MAEKNNKKQPLGIPETRGSFQMVGIVSGVQRDSFFSEKLTKTGSPRRVLSFGVQFNKDQRQYVELAGMEQRSVWCTKSSGEGKNRTIDTLEVPWRDRNTKIPDGYRLIGVKVGLEQMVDEFGKVRNKVMDMTPYDACYYASEHMEDDVGVFVRGNITYSTYRDTHRKRFELAQISHMAAPNFDDPNYNPMAQFTQRIVFMGIQPTDDKSRYVLSAKIITYNSVEDAEFYVEDRDLALSFRKGMTPYTAVETYGIIRTVKQEEDAKPSNSGLYWGKPNPMKTRTAPTKVELVITGVQEETIDDSIYSEESINNAIRIAKNLRDSKADYGDADASDDVPWGKNANLNTSASDDDEDEDW